MRRRKLGFQDALKLVKGSRSIVNMNAGFERQLRSWAQMPQDKPDTTKPIRPKALINVISVSGLIDFVEADRGR